MIQLVARQTVEAMLRPYADPAKYLRLNLRANSNCIAFDYTTASGGGSCRGVKDGGPLGGGKDDPRKFCVMTKGKNVRDGLAIRARDGYACATGQIAPKAEIKRLGQ